MKRIMGILSVLSVVISGVIIICTFLTTYQFYYVAQMFNSYFAVQLSIAITMGVWAYRFWLYEQGRKRVVYTSISLFISIILLYLTQYIN